MFEYKVVPAPQRAVKVKGLKTTSERFAHALAERINAEAAGGWEFLRTETLACEERTGLGRVRSSTQTVMVFARALGQARPNAGAALAAVQAEPFLRDGGAPGLGEEHDWAAPAEDWHAHEPDRNTRDDWPPVADEVSDAPQPAPARRQEPLFRSGARLHDDRPGRAEPVVRSPRPDRPADDD